MGKLITIIGPSGVGKTALVRALARAHDFATALEQHDKRPFQALFKQDPRYGLANQIDYFLLRAEQERTLRATSRAASPRPHLSRRISRVLRMVSLCAGMVSSLESPNPSEDTTSPCC